jgi:hypothetical protein
MRLNLLIVTIALLSGGCAARTPLAHREAAAAPATPSLLASVPAQEDWNAPHGKRLSMVHACAAFVERGGAAPVGEDLVEESRVEAGRAVEREEVFKRHEIALFLGYTSERAEGGPTIGLDYAYWFNERVGVGPFVDYVAGEIEAVALGAGIWFRPFRRAEGLAFYVAPGIDITNEKEDGKRSWEASALLRLGGTYGFDIGRGLRLMPSFYMDLIAPDKQAFVIGLSIGREF